MDHGQDTEDRFYIPATSTTTDDRACILKHGETFAVFDRYGDIQPVGNGSQGLYHEGTRFLSRLDLRLDDSRPMLLSSTVKEDNALLAVDLTNPDIYLNGHIAIPRGSLHLFRAIFLWQGTCYERLLVTNYGLGPIDVTLAFRFDADFADLFEVRGTKRNRKGRRLNDAVGKDLVQLGYQGLDGVTRQTRVHAGPRPHQMSSTQTIYEARLQPKEEASFFLTVSCECADRATAPPSYDQAFFQAEQALQSARARDCVIDTSNEQFNDWLNRSQPDLHMMITETPTGPYPYAGVPWFSAPFGRDGLITALESLWINPDLARGVLAYLASGQATEVVSEQDAEPGKILHEARKGEMAALGEIPFGRYYGSVVATPLFVMLAGAYYERTGDRGFLETLWPHLELALAWIDIYGDPDGDGFIEYARHSSNGLLHQGWKDSHDAVFHADGSLAGGPIALCEVQGYVYAAKSGAAALAQALERTERADQLFRQAATLRKRFEEAFWCEEIATYALALDGGKRACQVRTSNAGHCLWTGIAAPERARRVAETLLGKDSFSGWGVRTVGAGEARYNPMSYHNGSVWPHDNAVIAMGLARYGLKNEALRILAGLFDATLFLDLHRLPELFCGFTRRPGEGPGLYPVACSPQAWSVASVYLLLQACLGIQIDGREGRITLSNPSLPEFLQEVRIRNLRVKDGSVDLLLQRHPQDVSISVLRKEGRVTLVARK
ncbi:MAG: amylo-alpha-1,6-glucosidase [Nitrospirota bacterium]|nr:amylo-alpha-1,6-glucosidase [Nitrospirota bacterium]